MEKKIVVMHKRFSTVFNEELKAHGIKSSEFMLSCPLSMTTSAELKRWRFEIEFFQESRQHF